MDLKDLRIQNPCLVGNKWLLPRICLLQIISFAQFKTFKITEWVYEFEHNEREEHLEI